MNKREWNTLINSLDVNSYNLEEIFDILDMIKKDNKLDSDFKEGLISKLEPFLSADNDDKESKGYKDNAENKLDESESYPSYECIFDDFEISNKSWQDINPDNLDYPIWLLKIGLPEFWNQPKSELQHPLLVVCSFINSYAIPTWSAKARKEAQLPLVVFSGESRSGKTEGSKFILQNYSPRRTAIIKADSSGVALRDTLHYICYDDVRERLMPSCILVDNFEHQFLEKWGSFKMLLLSVLKSQAKSSIGSKEGKKDYYAHALKLFTTVESIKAFNGKQSEFYNRQVFLFTERQENVKSIGNYSFSDVSQIYKDIWNVEDTKNKWFPILASLLKLDDNATACPPYRWAQSIVIMATGIYIGIWGSIKEASDFMASYWYWVEERENQFKFEMELLVKAFLVEFYNGLNIGHWLRIITSKRFGETSLEDVYTTFRTKDYARFRKDEMIAFCIARASGDRKAIVKFAESYLEMNKYVLELDEKNHPVYYLPLDFESTQLLREV